MNHKDFIALVIRGKYRGSLALIESIEKKDKKDKKDKKENDVNYRLRAYSPGQNGGELVFISSKLNSLEGISSEDVLVFDRKGDGTDLIRLTEQFFDIHGYDRMAMHHLNNQYRWLLQEKFPLMK